MIHLDTNAAIAILNQHPPTVRRRLERALNRGTEVSISAIAAFELWYGVAKSARKVENAAKLTAFFSGPVDVVPFEREDGAVAGELRAFLKAAGQPIGPYDVLIAAQAIRHGATLVTANTAEFRRVPGLKVEDWSR